MNHPGRTDEQLITIDVPEMLGSAEGRHRWFADGAVAAAIQADRLEVRPRSLTFLAEIVRRGGIGYAADLPEPLPTAEQSALARSWLTAAAGSDDATVARWLDAVATVTAPGRSAV
jgi:hypothetical protein